MRQARDPADDDHQEDHDAADNQPGRDLALTVLLHVLFPLVAQAEVRIFPCEGHSATAMGNGEW